MTASDPLLAAIDKLTRRRKVGIWHEGHVHDWQPCAGDHPVWRDLIRVGAPKEPDDTSIVSVDPGRPWDPEHPELRPIPATYVQRALVPEPCIEWWERQAQARINVGVLAADAVRYGWAMGRSERCEMLICSGCGEVVAEEPAEDPLELHIHTEVHQPLLVMLMTGDGRRRVTTGGEHGLPFDVEALAMRSRIEKRLKELGKAIGFEAGSRGLARELRAWYLALQDAEAKGKVSAAFLADARSTVEHWVEEIETKFEPAEIREWTDACPRCHARRIEVDGLERFAIRVNVGARRAECGSCGEVWEGERGLRHLRYETNLVEKAKPRHAEARSPQLPEPASSMT